MITKDCTDPEDVLQLQDYQVREEIRAKCTTDDLIRTYFTNEGSV